MRERTALIRAASVLLLLCLIPWACLGRAETRSFGTAKADSGAEYIDLGEETIENWEAFYAFLSGFPELRKVDLFATEIGRDRIEDMTERFPEITFGMTMRIQEHVLRTDATAFSTLHTPKSPHHGDEDLSLIRFCTNLYALDLGHNALTDLSFLYALPELRVLILAMNNIRDITPVGSLEHLEYLEIFNNRITDVSCLSGLRHLTDLSLAGNNIGDLSGIAGIGSLKRLWMNDYDRKLSFREIRETAERMRAALPECEVDAVSGGVGGTWREHPRYEVIRRIFATGVYEPFE